MALNRQDGTKGFDFDIFTKLATGRSRSGKTHIDKVDSLR